MAARVLDANWKNVVRKVAAGRTLNASELGLIKAKAAGSDETVTHVRDVADLARVLGVTRQTLYAWRKKPDAPQPAANGSHDVVAWRDFINKHDLKAGLSPDAEVLKARKLLAEIEDRELRVAIRKGEYVPVEQVKEVWTTHIGKGISLLRARFENELPPLLVGLNAPDIQAKCAKAIDDVCGVLHGDTPARA
jgi:transposase-like protein